MKSTGIVRRVDDLGRIALPIELRRVLNIGIKDALEIFVEDEKIVLRKYEPACVFCDTADNVIAHNGRLVCEVCIKELYQEIS
jgi:transcriptional pleiotropic regulator of transition state genes